MRRVGAVVGAAQGVAVARAADDDPPELGTHLVDERLDAVGAVVDVFGPVERPYLAVATECDDIAPLVGSVVYAQS